MEKRRWCFDIESSSLLDDSTVDYTASPWKLKESFKIHCIVAICLDDGEVVRFVQQECYSLFPAWAKENVGIIIGHNMINFDLLALKAALGMDYTVGPDTWQGEPVEIIDTLVMSKTLNPDRKAHSLDYFGEQVGLAKIDWRAKAIELGLIDYHAPKGAEFLQYHPEMLVYNERDVVVNIKAYELLRREWGDWPWQEAYDLEKAVAEIITRQSHRGFWLDVELAKENVKELDILMAERRALVEPALPMKPMGKTKLKEYIPCKNQFLKNGEPSANIIKWCEKHGGSVEKTEEGYQTNLYGKTYTLPIPQEPIVQTEPSNIEDTTFIKGFLVEMGWQPTQYKERDLTVDTRKQKLTQEKFKETVERYVEQTLNSPFCKDRCERVGASRDGLRDKLLKHDLKKPLKVYTNPTFTVGQEKEMDPALEKLGEKFPHVKSIVEFLTYRHRRNSILGGGVDPDDWEDEDDTTSKGFLANVRADGRIPTPADTCGAACIVEDSLLVTDAGLKRVVDVCVGDLVLTHEGNYDRVVDLINNGIKKVLTIEDEHGNSLTCTENHKFYTPSGWVAAEALVEGSEVYSYQNAEKWATCAAYPTYYVSSWGRVISQHGAFITFNRRDKLWSRATVDLTGADGNEHREGVGRLVLMAFVGMPVEGLECCHIDGNPTNNYVGNLYWGTSKENKADAKLHGRSLKASRSRSSCVINQATADEIIDFFNANGYKRGDDTRLARQYGISRRAVGEIREGKRWAKGNTDNLYREKYKISKIVSIKEAGLKPTFDVTVENAHSYVSNSFVTHNTGRFKHRVCVNVARVSSLYGEPMRRMFGIGDKSRYAQFAFDFASLENRVQSHYCYRYDSDKAYCNSLILEKPLDSHTQTAKKVSEVIGQEFSRQSAKSVGYACVYGAQAARVAKTVGCDIVLGQKIFDAFWEASTPLLMLKERLTQYWKTTGQKKFILGLDNRKINTRSEHALLNSLFQSAGIICAKRTMVFQEKLLKERGLSVDFWKDDWKRKQYVQQIMHAHDEAQFEVTKDLIKWKKFADKESCSTFIKDNNEWLGPVKSERGYFAGYSVISDIVKEAVELTNKHYKLNVPMAVDPQFGTNWAECH